MAVVQISKIQLRRGRKLVNGIPQLSSGELAWAIDTQELYIGNGAVSEGAPAVGNTRVLTENDTLLDLLEQYQYKPETTIVTGTEPEFPIARTLQQRLDEGSVNAKSFGIVGDDILQDQTEKIQNIIDQIAKNLTPDYRVSIDFDPGVYTLTGTVYLPSNLSISGSGKDKTVFNFAQGGLNYGIDFSLDGTAVARLTDMPYNNISPVSVTGSGSGVKVSVILSAGAAGDSYSSIAGITIQEAGSGYAVGDQILIPGNLLGGTTPANDMTLTVSLDDELVNPVFATQSVFKTLNDDGSVDSLTSYNNQTKNISLKGFTVSTNKTGITPLDLKNVRDSYFSNIKLIGENLGTNIVNETAISLFSNSAVVGCVRNKFFNIDVEGFTFGVFSNTETNNNHFNGFSFKNLYRGVSLGENAPVAEDGPCKNTISNSLFENITNYGILVDKGHGNKSRGNTFVNVGGSIGNNLTSQIKFTSSGNSSLGDTFDRADVLSRDNFGAKYIAEVEGSFSGKTVEATTIELPYRDAPTRAFRVAVNNATSVRIDYVFNSLTFGQIRSGTMHIAIDRISNKVQFVDDYEYAGATGEQENLTFTGSISTILGVRELMIRYTNLNFNDDNTFTYTVSLLS